MPQLEKFTYFSQFFWLCLLLSSFYVAICNDGDGILGISMMDYLPLALGNGAPLPDLNLPLLPDPVPPAELPREPYIPLFPLVGSLSSEEQRAVARLVRLENGLIRTATHVLESLGFSPQPDDVKNVVQTFILDLDSDSYEGLRLALMDISSPVLMSFIEAWENYT